MDLALRYPSAYPFIRQGFRRAKSANHLPVRDTPPLLFALQHPSFEQSLSRITINGGRGIELQEKGYSSFSLMGRSKKGIVCCKKQSNNRGTSNPNKSNQEEIMSLLKRIQSSISEGGGSRGVEETKNCNDSSENESLTKAILDVLEKPRNKTEGDTSVKEPPKRQVEVPRPPTNFAKKTPIPSESGPRGKLPVSNSNKALGEMNVKAEKASLIETMKLAELKEVAKNRGIKGYSKLRKSELLELIRSS